MTNVAASLGLLLLTSLVSAQTAASPGKGASTPEALKAQIEDLKPAKHAWREIQWLNCPLEALQESRAKNKPVIVWLFLGNPTDERC